MNVIAIMKPNETLAALNKLIERIEPAVNIGLDAAAEKISAEAKKTTAFKGDSPNGLRKAIKVIRNGSLERTVLADKDYAYYVEFGNNQKGPYIYPVRAKALHFFINGQEFFCKRVRSHGPLPFMRPAYENIKPDIIPTINEVLTRVIKGVSNG